MKSIESSLKVLGFGLLALGMFTGCESTDGGAGAVGSSYYGIDVYDPWYYGDYHHDADIIVTPPAKPVAPAHPSHPIATPPPSAPRPTPLPSIPSMPRASFHR